MIQKLKDRARERTQPLPTLCGRLNLHRHGQAARLKRNDYAPAHNETCERQAKLREMRVSYALQGLLAASTTMVASYNPQLVVLGTDGTIVDADPSLYFRPSKTQLHHNIRENELVQHFPDLDKEIADPVEVVELPFIETQDELLEMETSKPHMKADEDDFPSSISLEGALSSEFKILSEDAEDHSIPGVFGSVIFAELVQHLYSSKWRVH